MKILKILPLFFLTFLFILNSPFPVQTKAYPPVAPPIYMPLQNTPTKYTSEILTYLNELRQDPPSFYHKYVKGYIKQKSGRFTSFYTSSLKNTLLHQKPLPLFNSTELLQNLAARQLTYLTQTVKGKYLTHNQGNLSFSDRIKGTQLHCFAENLYRSQKSTAREVVLDLLIDQGVSSLGHRKNILNPDYTAIGIKSANAPNGYRVTVMDFSCPKK